jgi:hypothetical protein
MITLLGRLVLESEVGADDWVDVEAFEDAAASILAIARLSAAIR